MLQFIVLGCLGLHLSEIRLQLLSEIVDRNLDIAQTWPKITELTFLTNKVIMYIKL